MDDFLFSIKSSLDNKNYYAALFMAIMMPSVCNALASRNGDDTKSGYISWFNMYVPYLFMTGQDCYNLRCSLLHQGASMHNSLSFSRILFTFPIPHGNTLHNNVMNDALNLDIPMFCFAITEGVKTWLNDMKDDKNYNRNHHKLLKTHPKGLAPYIVGHPIIS